MLTITVEVGEDFETSTRVKEITKCEKCDMWFASKYRGCHQHPLPDDWNDHKRFCSKHRGGKNE